MARCRALMPAALPCLLPHWPALLACYPTDLLVLPATHWPADKSELDNVVELFLRFSLASLPGGARRDGPGWAGGGWTPACK